MYRWENECCSLQFFGVDTVQISRSADLLSLSNLLHVHVYFISTFIKDLKKYHRTAASVINTQRK